MDPISSKIPQFRAWLARYGQLGVKNWGARRGLLDMAPAIANSQAEGLWKACERINILMPSLHAHFEGICPLVILYIFFILSNFVQNIWNLFMANLLCLSRQHTMRDSPNTSHISFQSGLFTIFINNFNIRYVFGLICASFRDDRKVEDYD